MKRLSFFAILTAGVLWGCIGLFVRPLNALGLASMEIVFLRALVTGVGLLGYLLLFRREALRLRLQDLWCFLGTGIASILFFNFCYFRAITVTSLSVAAVLLYTAPAMVMVMSRFLFGEAFSRRKGLSLVLTILGCVLVTGVLETSQPMSGMGILLGLGAGFGYALYSIFSRFALERGYTSLTITCYTFLIAACASALTVPVDRVLAGAFGSWQMGLFSVAFGLLCTVVPYLLYTLGLREVDNSRASILASIEPVTASALGVLVFGEHLSLGNLAGMVLVLWGMAICSSGGQ